MTDASASKPDDGLTFGMRGLVLLIAVVIFTFATGPIWLHPYDINQAVLWSYLAIPVLVGVVLQLTRRWSIRAAILESAILLTTKFGITYVFTALLWSISGPPPRAARPPVVEAPVAPPVPPPVPTAFAPADLGEVHGQVIDESGQPVANALVYVASGLEGLVFKPSNQPVVLVNDGTGFKPALDAVQAGQPVTARSTDSRLHTVRVYKDNAVLLNVPAITRQSEHRFTFDQAHGETRIVCGVHEAAGTEAPARLVVLSHGFSTLTDAQGSFHLSGIPARRVALAVMGPAGCGESQTLLVRGGQDSAAELRCMKGAVDR